MTTALTQANHLTQLYGQSLPPQERSKHRAWIGVRVEALLDPYWQNRPNEATKAEILGDWMAALEAFTEPEIRAACREWNNQPRAPKPKTGDIRAIILRERKPLIAAKPEPPKPEPVSGERANEILAEIGFKPKTFNAERQV